jgi:peptidoglycan hydrolase CwlO-like protein
MPVTEKDLEAQQLQIEQLGNELARLDGIFADALKAAGVTEAELKKLDPDNQPPEIKKLLDEANSAAKRAGEERTRAAKSQQQQAAPSSAPRSRRGGAISA